MLPSLKHAFAKNTRGERVTVVRVHLRAVTLGVGWVPGRGLKTRWLEMQLKVQQLEVEQALEGAHQQLSSSNARFVIEQSAGLRSLVYQ